VAAPIESVLSDELENFANVDRKQHSVKQKHRIELCRKAIHDEQDIACDTTFLRLARRPSSPADSRTSKSSSRISAPYFTASRASL
jgi:hypothetical protein